MIAPWPRKSPHAKAAKRLREAANTTAHTDALADIDSLRSTQTDDITNRHLTNIRDDLAALIDESERS